MDDGVRARRRVMGGGLRPWTTRVLCMVLVLSGWLGLDLAGGGATDGVAQAVGPLGTSVDLQDDASSAVSWSGKRSTQKTPEAYGGSLVSLSGKGSATFTFQGVGAQWWARTGPFDGRADVYVDGRRVAHVDLYARVKSYQQAAYEVRGLRDGKHTLRVVRTGTKNSRSTGRNVTVDAFRAFDDRSPAAPPAPVVRAEGSSARISWDGVADRDVAGYRVVRRSAGSLAPVVVGTTGPAGRALVDVGLTAGVRYTFAVQAVDTSGNDSSWSAAVPLTLPAQAPPDTPRYATCPPATVTVGDVTALAAALAGAGPGTVIHLLPGRYPGQVQVTVRGTAEAPVWVCGPRSAVLDGGGPTRNGGLRIADSAHLVVAGLTVRSSQKGVSVLASTAVVLADLSVSQIGEEAVHLKFGTTDSVVIGNSIDHTGLVTPAYGEGVYVGTDRLNWCAWTACGPDRSDRNRIERNSIRATAAEPIEVKEGTADGVVSGNTIDGAGTSVGRLVALKGNGWTVTGNQGRDGGIDGVQVLAKVGYGLDNLVFGNDFDGRLTGYGVRVPAGDLSTVVGCDTRVPRGARGISNQPCQP